MVPNERVTRTTLPAGPERSTQPTTLFLCTSSPAQQAWTTSIARLLSGKSRPRGQFVNLSRGLVAPQWCASDEADQSQAQARGAILVRSRAASPAVVGLPIFMPVLCAVGPYVVSG